MCWRTQEEVFNPFKSFPFCPLSLPRLSIFYSSSEVQVCGVSSSPLDTVGVEVPTSRRVTGRGEQFHLLCRVPQLSLGPTLSFLCTGGVCHWIRAGSIPRLRSRYLVRQPGVGSHKGNTAHALSPAGSEGTEGEEFYQTQSRFLNQSFQP